MLRAAQTALAVSLLWLLATLVSGGTVWTPAFLAAASAWALVYKRRDKQPASFCALSALTVYLSTFRWHGGDDLNNSLIPIAALRYHTLTLDPVIVPFLVGKTDFLCLVNGHNLSFHPIFTGLLAIPFYLIPVVAHAPVTETFLHNMSKVSASCLTAFSVFAFYKAAEARAAKRWALGLTLVYAFGTFAFPVSSQALYQHGATQLGAALGFWGLWTNRRWSDFLAGLGFGVAVAARGDSALFAAAAGLYLLIRKPKGVPGFLAGAAIPVALIGSYWVYYTGNFAEPSTGSQLSGFGAFKWNAFMALAVSPSRGLLWFCPAAFFSIAGLTEKKERLLYGLMIGAAAAYWFVIAHFWAWSGGESFGTRYFALAVTAMLLLVAPLEPWIRASPRRLSAWTLAGAFSIVVNALGGYLTWPGSHALSEQMAVVWQPLMHPWLNLLSSRGALGSLPSFVRLIVCAGLIWACLGLARGLRRVVQ